MGGRLFSVHGTDDGPGFDHVGAVGRDPRVGYRARPVDVEELFPELRPWRREAVRLHPRSGRPSIQDSSVGGPLLWPQDQPCPVYDGQHHDPDSHTPYEGEVYLVPVVQLHRDHAPDSPFPRDSTSSRCCGAPPTTANCAAP